MAKPVYSKMVLNARGGQGLTQRKLAARIGVKASHIAYIENGRRKPSLALILKLAKVLRINALALATETHPELKKIIAAAEAPA